MNAIPQLQEWLRRGPATFPPRWASAWGDDRYGLWADLDVTGVVQRLRWIEPGSFLMGDEEKPETQLPASIVTGFWLADTACTQALWLAVMGGNPSYFTEDNTAELRSPQHPVEQVSWNDIALPPNGFLVRLQRFTAGALPELPGDAEWEYACRAGTRTAYSFGDEITAEQVNYGGSRKKLMTVAVKSLPANPWGLHEMHGNVWEWCANPYTDDGASPATGPPGEAVAERALRGGSWSYAAGLARSAGLGAFWPDRAIRDFGFRFALRS